MSARLTSSLLIATYNWPEALGLVLASVRAQHVPPDEVLIADDGSRDDTRALVEQEAGTFPVPLRHIWHEDRGFRLATIRNKSMAAARGEYLIQLDGDIVLHPEFVHSHLRFARRGWYVQGSRAMLDASRTAEALRTGRLAVTAWSAGVRNRANVLYLPALAYLIRGPRDPLQGTRGCNMAFWRDDIIRVNGYNEEMEGWGREDSELAARLQNADVHRRNLKFAAVGWHLHHPVQPQHDLARNHTTYELALRERRVRCDRGIDQWIT